MIQERRKHLRIRYPEDKRGHILRDKRGNIVTNSQGNL